MIMFLTTLSFMMAFNFLFVMMGLCRNLFLIRFLLPIVWMQIVWNLLSVSFVFTVVQLFLHNPSCLKLLVANLLMFVESLLKVVLLEAVIQDVMSFAGRPGGLRAWCLRVIGSSRVASKVLYEMRLALTMVHPARKWRRHVRLRPHPSASLPTASALLTSTVVVLGQCTLVSGRFDLGGGRL